MTSFAGPLRNSGWAVLGLAVFGCSGGASNVTPQFSSTLGLATLTSFEATGTDIVVENGSLILHENEVAVGVLTGTLNDTRDSIALTAGGTAALTTSGYAYMRTFTADPLNSPRQIGLVGIDAKSLPAGTGTYAGETTLTVRDGTTIYDLEGASAVAANFATGSVVLTLNDLDGTMRPAFMAPSAVSDVGTITISNAAITGTSYEGGTAALDSTTLNAGAALDATATSNLRGGFFGTNGAETGGIFTLRDDSAQTFVVQGEFVAK